MNVLIVDAHETSRSSLEALLKADGHQVQSAADGVEAFEKLRAGGIDLIICDLPIPGMDGLHFSRKVKSNETLRHIPLFFCMAGRAGIRDEAFARQIGADRIIGKPCDPEALITAIRHVMADAGCIDGTLESDPGEQAEISRIRTQRLAKALELKVHEAEKTLKESEKQLRQSEERLRLTLESTQIGIWDWDIQNDRRYCSPTCYSMLGYQPEEGLEDSREWVAIVHPDDLAQVNRTIQDVLENHSDECQYEARLRHADGTYRWCLVRGVSIERDEAGQATRILGIRMDISERKRWEEALKASERRYKALFNEAPVMYVITENRDGEPVIQDVNQQFLKTLGFSREEVIGTILGEFYTPETLHDLDIKGERFRYLRGDLSAVERSFITRDKRIVTTLLHARPELAVDGRVIGTRAMFLDITARKQAAREAKKLENALAQAQKMEAIGTLAGGIAHDFNNILSGIVGYAQLAIHDTEKNSHLRYYLEQIYTAGMRAGDLVSQILSFSRQSNQDPHPLQAGPLIKEALSLLRSSLPATIEIDQEINHNTDNVMADPTQIHQIVMNLCTNAAHAMEAAGGKMTVRLDQVHLSAPDAERFPGLVAGDYVKLTVEDNGCGIMPEIMEKIFDPYFTTKAQGKGTGLGLSVVQGIAKSAGGGAYAHSRPGAGATFDVYFPAIKEQTAPEPETAGILPTGSETILLVDDEPLLIEVGRQILQMLGYTVLTCTDGQEALQVFGRAPEKIDLVISDVTMPKMTGDDLAARLHRIRKDLPIILCTGFSERLSHTTMAEIGVQAIVMKPPVTEKLAALIRKVLDGGDP